MGTVPVCDKFIAAFDIYDIAKYKPGSGESSAGAPLYRHLASRKKLESVTAWLQSNVVEIRFRHLRNYVVIATDKSLRTTRCTALAWMQKHG